MRLNVRLSELEKEYAEQLKQTMEEKGEKILDARKQEETKESRAKSRRRIAIISAATVAGAGWGLLDYFKNLTFNLNERSN